MATYNCDSCGRVATRVRANKGSRCCNQTTKTSVEIAAEIPIPKCEFGTDFIAVVCRGKVVDILLLSDRTSVYDSIGGWAVQAYVDNLHVGDEFREPTDIEVNYGNNVYLVRLTDGVVHIMISAMGTPYCFGDSYLSTEEREAILTLAQNNTPSERVAEFVQGCKRLSMLLIEEEIAAEARAAELKTKQDAPAMRAQDGILSAPDSSLHSAELRLTA